MKGGHFEQNLNDMDPKMTALVARSNSEHVVGVKLAHYRGHDWELVHRLVEAGERADIPVMVDFGSADPPLSLEILVLITCEVEIFILICMVVAPAGNLC